MAAINQSVELMQNLSLETSKSASDSSTVPKQGSGNQFKSKKVGGVSRNGHSQFDRPVTPFEYYLPNGYPAYYYGGYDGEEYPIYYCPDAAGWDFYNHGYGYPLYDSYAYPGSPFPATVHDGQFYGPQHHQLPTSFFQPPASGNLPKFAKKNPISKAVSTSAADQPSLSVETTKANTNGISKVKYNGNTGSTKLKSGQQNPLVTSNGTKISKGVLSSGLPSSGYQAPKFGFDAMWPPVGWNGSSQFPDVQKKTSTVSSVTSKATHASDTPTAKKSNLNPLPQHMGMHAPQPGFGPVTPGIMNMMYPTSGVNYQTSNSFRNCSGFGPNQYDSRISGQWLVLSDNKYKARGRSNGYHSNFNGKLDGLGELHRGPRADRFIDQKGSGQSITHTVSGQSLPTADNVKDCTIIPDKEQYNKADFPETYADAKFFIIKSYSEDDFHKSIKYNVWASTPNGNKKLDLAYQESQKKTAGCPIFLFFSVNTSGQFIGVAEMVGPVDFNKTLEHWQQDKWTGCFPVKWHIVKDVPNSILKHITLDNNDYKPVTNSRDTQEVKLELGVQMIKIFKEHVSKTSILDDFSFYDDRQKLMQEKRAKLQQMQKKGMDGKPLDVEEKERDGIDGKPRPQLLLEAATVLKAEAHPDGIAEKVTAAIAVLSSKVPNSESEKNAESNGVVNGV